MLWRRLVWSVELGMGIGDVDMEGNENTTEITDVGKECGAVEVGSSTGVADSLTYSLDEINTLLDETFGKVVDLTDFFPDTEKNFVSVSKVQKEASLKELSQQKTYRL